MRVWGGLWGVFDTHQALPGEAGGGCAVSWGAGGRGPADATTPERSRQIKHVRTNMWNMDTGSRLMRPSHASCALIAYCTELELDPSPPARNPTCLRSAV